MDGCQCINVAMYLGKVGHQLKPTKKNNQSGQNYVKKSDTGI